MILEVQDLSFTIQGKRLLDQVRLDLAAGEFLAVLGRNGAGKSTLLKHLSGETPASTGVIRLFGTDLKTQRVRDLATRRAVLAQHTQLDFGYDVIDVVLLGRLPHLKRGAESEADRVIARRCLARVGLGEYAGRNYLTLSGGEQQRVHLARVLAQLEGTEGPRALLLDEPTSSLDLAHQHMVLEAARSLSAEGVGVLAILHDLNLAALYADRVLMLSGGRVSAYGTPGEVLVAETIEAAFGHPVTVLRHPEVGCPLVVSLPR